jgi:hypothetical protein
VDLLVGRHECTVEQVCERLSALRRPTARETVVRRLEGMMDDLIVLADGTVYLI